jgi:hypothetical protein
VAGQQADPELSGEEGVLAQALGRRLAETAKRLGAA